MKRIKLLTTGGTIASRPGAEGLAPAMGPGLLLRYIEELSDRFVFECEDLFQMDSSNIQPEEWQLIARHAYRAISEHDGVIITHGTDTMSYTASALSFMLQGIRGPVILTGSQIPIGDPLTDARTNLCSAAAAIDARMQGVMVAFDRKIMNGARTVKVSTMDFDAFHSVNAAAMAKIYADGIRVLSPRTTRLELPCELRDNLCTDVFLLKLIPGTSPEIFDALLKLNYKGIVVEAFGAGGIHYLHRDLLEKLRMLCDAGISVIVCSQCLYERSDLNIYEVGKRILDTGAVSAMDMTTEAAVTKLMWVLGQTENRAEIRRMFLTNYVGELAGN